MNRFVMAVLVLAVVMTTAACQTPTPLQQARKGSMRPGTLVDQRTPGEESERSLEDEAATAQDGAEGGGADLLAGLDDRDRSFNRRIDQVLGRGTGPQKVGRSEVKGKGQAIQGETLQVNFNFSDAELGDVVRLFMELLKENYALDPKVAGKVALHVDAELGREEIWELFRGVLRMHGATVILDNGLWRVLTLADAVNAVDEQGIVFSGESGSRKRGQSVQVYQLEYLPVSEFSEVIKPYLSPGSMVYGHEQSGVMLVSDFPHTLRKIERLVSIFDISAFAGLYMRVYSLKFAKAEDMIKELDGLVEATMFKQQGREKVSFLGLPRLNMIVALTWNESNLAFVEEWVRELDREAPAVSTMQQRENIFVYYVENGSAKNIVEALEGLFDSSGGMRDSESYFSRRRSRDGRVEETELPVGTQLAEQQQKASNLIQHSLDMSGATGDAGRERIGFMGQLSENVSFVVDEVTNSILVRCSPSDYPLIRGVIQKLDIFPRQVLIEVLIAEINLDETNKLGIEWENIFDLGGSATGTLRVDNSLGTVTPGALSPISGGLSYLIGNTERFKAALRASANENNVQILSSPHILASDNQMATIDIGSEVPVVTSQTQKEDTTSTVLTTQQNVQYRNTGILLTVTPHINDKGLVRMEVSQEVSELSDRVVEGISSPVFNKRKAETVLAVKDGQTIVIGGLISQSKADNYSGVPVLSRVPILKNLVGVQSKGWVNTELMLFITPHVVVHNDDAEFISRRFLDRVEFVKRGMH
ncbi:Type II secretion system protein D [anaerobic digester metagenome]